VLLYTDQGRSGLRIMTCSREAALADVRAGMPLAEARALWRVASASQPVYFPADQVADRQALQQLALDCQRYAPLVGLEEVDSSETLFLEIAGCEHLYGDEQGLLRALLSDLCVRGYEVRVAIADTMGAAWALAHYGTGMPCVTGEQQSHALRKLPVAALRLASPLLQTLRELEVLTIGDLQRLPRASLPARFGKTILQRLDQALGRCRETFTPEKFVEPLVEVWSTDEPLTDQQSVAEIFRQLLGRLLLKLSERQAGVLDLVCSFQAERPVPAIGVQLSRPTREVGHLRQLFALRCEQQAWPTGIRGVRVEIRRAGWLREKPRSLFDEDPQCDPRAVESLLERLSSRLGENAVVRPQRVADPLPERAYLLVPWLTRESSVQSAERRAPSFELRQRPWHLFATPQPLDVVSVVPQGPPERMQWNGQWQQIVRFWGPERIETGWWRERDVRRDYYRVETERGRHGWVFRQRESNHWFLHGWF
jgi:protein ImuB